MVKLKIDKLKESIFKNVSLVRTKLSNNSLTLNLYCKEVYSANIKFKINIP